jgi:hypothetical protein
MKPPTTSAPAPQLGTRPWLHVRTRAARVRPKSSRFFLRSDKLLLQNCAILHNAPQNGFVRLPNEKHAAQRDEKLRKKSLGNYKSAALPTELCRRFNSGKLP